MPNNCLTNTKIGISFLTGLQIFLVCANIIHLDNHVTEYGKNVMVWMISWIILNTFSIILITCIRRLSYVEAKPLYNFMVMFSVCSMIWYVSVITLNFKVNGSLHTLILTDLVMGYIIAFTHMIYVILCSVQTTFVLDNHNPPIFHHHCAAITDPNFLSIEIQTYSDTEMKDQSCPICIQNYSPDDETLMLKCEHRFHNICLREWFFSKNTCPVCRMSVS